MERHMPPVALLAISLDDYYKLGLISSRGNIRSTQTSYIKHLELAMDNSMYTHSTQQTTISSYMEV